MERKTYPSGQCVRCNDRAFTYCMQCGVYLHVNCASVIEHVEEVESEFSKYDVWAEYVCPDGLPCDWDE